MTYLYERRGPDYHWILDLFERMGLPLFNGMKEQVIENGVNTCIDHLSVDALLFILHSVSKTTSKE